MRAVRTPTVPDRGRPVDRSTVGVPYGLAISNILAEFVAHDIDNEIITLSSCEYFRYVDDILIFCAANELRDLAREAQEIITECGLTAHLIGTDHKSTTGLIASG